VSSARRSTFRPGRSRAGPPSRRARKSSIRRWARRTGLKHSDPCLRPMQRQQATRLSNSRRTFTGRPQLGQTSNHQWPPFQKRRSSTLTTTSASPSLTRTLLVHANSSPARRNCVAVTDGSSSCFGDIARLYQKTGLCAASGSQIDLVARAGFRRADRPGA
jgi:hypothetical protein